MDGLGTSRNLTKSPKRPRARAEILATGGAADYHHYCSNRDEPPVLSVFDKDAIFKDAVDLERPPKMWLMDQSGCTRS